MHGTIAELRRLEPLADIFAVRPVNLEGSLDELADGPHLFGCLRHHTPAAKVSEADERVRRKRVFGVLIIAAFAENFLGETRQLFGSYFDDSFRRQPLARLFQDI